MLYNQKVIQNFFWEDEYNYPGLKNCPWHENVQAQACLYLSFFFTHTIKHHLKFFVQYFQQKYMHMQIQYKNNYAKYAAFLIKFIVGFFPFGKGDDIILLHCRGGGFLSS